MYSTDFAYFRATSVADAHRLLAEHRGAKLLAGGHSLLPLLKLRLAAPPALIDIGRVAELRGAAVAGGTLRIGALTTHAELAASEAVRTACPALAEAAAHVGDAQVRNWGTIGGNIAHADPGSDLPTVLTAMNARIVASGPSGERQIAAEDFFVSLMATTLAEDEIVTAIEVPATTDGQGTAYVKFVHPASRYAVIGVAATATVQGDTCVAARVALGGLVARPHRAAHVERALVGASLDAGTLASAASLVDQDLGGDLIGDIFASAEYRRAVAPVYVGRALAQAAGRTRA